MTHGREGGAAEAAETVARRSYGKLVAFLAARTRDVAAAEEALSDAFAAALADWPRTGAPEQPEAWLIAVARRKLIDSARRRKTRETAAPQVGLMQEELAEVESVDIPDRRLALMFACAHPAIDDSVRAPLILQTVMGLNAQAIASAFLVSPAAMAKRLARAKDKIRNTGIPFAVPERADLPERLEAVLDAIYAAFAEGWTDAAGVEPARRELAGESLFLARLCTELMPHEPEALGLAALMMHAQARWRARRNATGDYVPLEVQDVSLWDRALIAEADELLRRAGRAGTLGRYEIEAAVQSAHARRRLSGRDNWRDVLALYDALMATAPTAVAAINRALAVANVLGPQSGLAALPDETSDPRLATYQPFWAARADLLAQAGRRSEASQAYGLAIGLERDPAVRRFLQNRQAALG